MSYTTIVPEDRVVILNGDPAFPVDMSSVDEGIHAIQFNNEEGKGSLEHKADKETGVIPPNTEITSLEPWSEQIKEAEEIIFCRKNPKTYYSTVTPVGLPVVVIQKGWPIPEGTTDKVPPIQPDIPGEKLYWFNDEFVWSPFPPDQELADCKNYTLSRVNTEAYNLLLPSDWMAARAFETGEAIPAEWSAWRAQIREEAKTKQTKVEEAKTKESLKTYCESAEFYTWTPSPEN